jgi:uncharacterized protein Veg
MTSIEEIKEKLGKHLGENVEIVLNGSRNKIEKYSATILEIYPFVFVVQMYTNQEKKSFSYSDVLMRTIEIHFNR